MFQFGNYTANPYSTSFFANTPKIKSQGQKRDFVVQNRQYEPNFGVQNRQYEPNFGVQNTEKPAKKGTKALLFTAIAATAALLGAIYFIKRGKAAPVKVPSEIQQPTSAWCPRPSTHRKPDKLEYKAIEGLLNRENLAAQDLRQIETIFKNHTGINLYCPEAANIKDFLATLGPLVNRDEYKLLPAEIKHIIVGHGIGSSEAGNWRFLGTGSDVFDFIEGHIPKGEKVLLVTCESASAVRPGLGGPVNVSLYDANKPGKVVESGIRRIIGSTTLLKPGVIEYF